MRAVNIIAALLTVAAIYFGKTILSPFFISLFLAILFEPVILKLMSYSISRKASAGLIVSGVLIASLGISASLGIYANNILLSLPAYSEKMENFSAQIEKRLELGQSFTHQETKEEEVSKIKISPTKRVFSWIGTMEELFNLVVFVPLLLLYFLIDKENLLESFYAIAGKYFYLPKLNLELSRMIRSFAFGNLVTAAALAVVQGTIIWYLGYKNYLILGFITGILNVVPVFGIPLAFIPLIIEGVLQFPSYLPITSVLVVVIILHLLATNFLMPILVGGRVNVNSGALIMGVLFWGWIWGGVGFLLAIPLTSFLKIFLECNRDCAPMANIMAAKPKYIFYFGKRTHPYR